MPLVPRESVFVPVPVWINTVPVLPNTRPSADWLALRFTVCAVLTVEMLNCATSAAPGGEAGLGVVALLAVDHALAVFQPVPVPSQKMVMPNAGTVGNAHTTITTASVTVKRSTERCNDWLMILTPSPKAFRSDK